MLTLIRNGRLYAPDEMGKRDVLIAAGKILKIAEKIDVPQNLEVKTVDAAGKFITPGFIDLHVHITGGGGEGGPATRVPEIQLSRITQPGLGACLAARPASFNFIWEVDREVWNTCSAWWRKLKFPSARSFRPILPDPGHCLSTPCVLRRWGVISISPLQASDSIG